VVARTNAVVGLSILLALFAGTLVGSLPGLPDWAPVAAVLMVGLTSSHG
jgi:TctA family transporter